MVELFIIYRMSPIRPMLRVRVEEKFIMVSFEPAYRFGVKIMPPRTLHGIGECPGLF